MRLAAGDHVLDVSGEVSKWEELGHTVVLLAGASTGATAGLLRFGRPRILREQPMGFKE